MQLRKAALTTRSAAQAHTRARSGLLPRPVVGLVYLSPTDAGTEPPCPFGRIGLMDALPEGLPEAWMRGAVAGVDPLVAPVLYSLQQAREDAARLTERLTLEQIWATPHGLGSVGFHLRHMAGSTDRLITYLQGGTLSPIQLEELAGESEPSGPGRDELLALLENAFRRAEAVVRSIDPATLASPRAVGRKRLPTTVIGLLTHIAEHTQRHAGQAIYAAKLAR